MFWYAIMYSPLFFIIFFVFVLFGPDLSFIVVRQVTCVVHLSMSFIANTSEYNLDCLNRHRSSTSPLRISWDIIARSSLHF